MARHQYKYRTLECISCGSEYSGNYPANRKYCSRNCWDTKRPTRVKRYTKTKKCKWCESEFDTKEKAQLFCSPECVNEWQGRNKSKYNCKTCGNEFGLSKSLAESRNYEIKFCSIKCRNENLEWQTSHIKANLKQQNNKGLNKLEKIGNEIMKDVGIEYQSQVLVFDKFLVDVFVPEKNIVIQWDGDYWHGHPTKLKNGIPDKRQKRRMDYDKSQDSYMKTSGYTILRFWESEIKNDRNKVYEIIKRAIQ
jgi:very-short-patch-repair endonuclease